MRKLLLLAIIPLVAPYARPAHAQVPVPEAESDESALMRQGVELRQAHQDEEALRIFRRAWDLSKSGRALAQVALAEQALGRWLDAEKHLGQALAGDQEPWLSQNRELLAEALHDIQGHLGWLELSGESKQGWVGINGKRVATLPVSKPLRVPAGSVAIEVQAEGCLPILRVVVVPSRGLAREPLEFVSAIPRAPLPPAPESPGPRRPDPRWSTRQIAGLAVGVAAMSSLSVGIAFHVIRQDRANVYKSLGCDAPTPSASWDRCQSRYDSIGRATTWAITGYVGAAALSGVAAYLLLSGKGAPVAAPSGATTLSCGPWAGRGVLCAGHF